MSYTINDAWFYSTNGQQHGPVTRAELEKIIVEEKLHPRYTQCWTKGMDHWKPAGEIEGLCKIDAPPPQLPNTTRQEPPRQLAKRSESELECELRNANWPGFSRRYFIFGTWLLPLLIGAAMAALAWYLSDGQDPAELTVLPWLLAITVTLVVVVVIAIWLGRLSNLGMSRWWFLGSFVPLLNIWVGFRALCCPAGYEYHRKMDGLGVFLAILYWGFIALWVLSVVVSIIAALGMLGGTAFEFNELIERVREEMEQQLNDGELPPAQE